MTMMQKMRCMGTRERGTRNDRLWMPRRECWGERDYAGGRGHPEGGGGEWGNRRAVRRRTDHSGVRYA